ncbi:type VII secretion protein EccB [Nonomuraea sp. NBC_01738]|uniref:type VII secretion protein EccB n=1 Tax=Nonomuraea sp. NBC_01738 TaxID=2976003 RepID=UPI002E144C76|nr:type VII secretion protein EccB [Nonomuraea sp. NBC_01738]
MQTRKDLYQAHRLMTQRLGLALLQGEPDLPESPMRRHNVASFAGVLVAVLIAAGFGIWGLLSPGGATKLKDPGQLLVEEETGASYIYDTRDNKLRPVANYVSARLMLEADEIKVRSVSAKSLTGFARGQKIGIAGAPESLPKPDRLVKSPWNVCVVEGTDPAGVRKPYVTLTGGIEVGGTPVGNGALVVSDGQQNWILWNNARMLVRNVGRLLDQAPRKVPAAWINAIPAGADFAAPQIPQRGARVAGPGGRAARAGQVFTVPPVAGTPQRWYVLMTDGLAPISQTQAQLLLQDPASTSVYGKQRVRELTIDAATANATKVSARHPLTTALPQTMPHFRTPGAKEPLCALYANTVKGSVRAVLTTGSTFAFPTPATSGGGDKVDQVLLPAGQAALAGHLPTEGQISAMQEYSLVTDQGRRFRLASADVVGKLGYEAKDVTPVPINLLRLIPEGPVLDPAAARTPIQETPSIRPNTQ